MNCLLNELLRLIGMQRKFILTKAKTMKVQKEHFHLHTGSKFSTIINNSVFAVDFKQQSLYL